MRQRGQVKRYLVSGKLTCSYCGRYLTESIHDTETCPAAFGRLRAILNKRKEILTEILTIWAKMNSAELSKLRVEYKNLQQIATWSEAR